ncbi:MAG: Glu/Leu/Phe/Val dehydrogenase dimerization domain-containing protein [bacterium]|uniref:Glutamate dehydrogenase n=2 Tax=Bacteria candidate phyla TaxID=1783234 RepID=A0A124G0R0_UNCT6|nr:MAG: Glutamate dehydrogenase [candidate division TA06 bacterium 32_111]KUK88267.1 MAG: Glutamate dehydrogenase [candidate division TA06 bacterium 34_109]MDI6701072.1 Glu/Leu/Phe/Val dehydrogenase dimerization domain-containing protein [bacterium]HAF07200.1 hypothetical protein [candidate division WOR-3 bacterium]HCP16051.1 hypothetical protein [candidate division WOR-3 bacterium]
MVDEKVIYKKNGSFGKIDFFLENFNDKEKETILNIYNFKEIFVNIPLKSSDGEIKNVTGVKVDNFLSYNNTFSNLRIHPYFDINYFRDFAILNTITFSLFGIPVNGSFSSILIDPFEISTEEKEEVFKMFSSLLKNEILEKEIFFSSDVNSNYNDIKIFTDSFHFDDLERKKVISFLDYYNDLKKDIDIDKLNEFSVFYSILKYCELKKKSFDELSVVIYGFGEKPYFLSKILKKEGFNIVGILTHLGSFYDPYGIQIDEFYKNYLSNFSSKEEARYKKIDLYTFENVRSDISIFYVDIFKKDFLKNLNTSLIVEGRKMLLGEMEIETIEEKGIELLPSELTCSGEILLYDELRKNRIPKKIATMIQKEIYEKMDEIFETDGEDLRTKILKISFKNILENLS